MAVLYGAYRTDIKAIDHVKLIPDRSPSIDFKQIDLLGARCPLFFNLNHRISAPGASGSLEVVYHTVDVNLHKSTSAINIFMDIISYICIYQPIEQVNSGLGGVAVPESFTGVIVACLVFLARHQHVLV